MDRRHTQSPARISPSNGRFKCGDPRTIAIRQSYGFHPQTATLWTMMTVFTLGFWGCLSWVIFG